MLEHYRRFLALRKSQPALARGGIAFHGADDEALLIFTRDLDGESVLCVFNISAAPATVRLPDGAWDGLEGTGFSCEAEGNTIKLPAWGAYFARKGA